MTAVGNPNVLALFQRLRGNFHKWAGYLDPVP